MNEQQTILTEGIAEAVRDALTYAFENELALTTSPVAVVEMADGSGRFAVLGCFADPRVDFSEVHVRRIVGSFNQVEVLH